MNPTAVQDAAVDETPTAVINEQADVDTDTQTDELGTDEEVRAHRKPVLLPNRVGFVALIVALVGLVLAILVLFVNIAWFLPLVAIVPAITLGILGLTLVHHRKLTSIAAIVLSLIALIPSVTGYMMMTSADTVVIGGGTRDTASTTPTLDALMGILTGGTDNTGNSDGDGDGNQNASGTGDDTGDDTGTTPGTTTPGTTTPGTTTPGTTTPGGTTPGTTTPGTTTPGTTPSTPIIDVQIGTGTTPPTTTTPTTPTTPAIIAVTTGGIGSLLTTSSGVRVTVNSSQCGLPLIKLGGISLGVSGVLCAVNVSVTNGSNHIVDINSAGLTGLVGGAGYVADSALGSALSAHVAVGSSATGSLYVLLPLGSSTLDTVKIRLGGEPASSLLTVKVL